MVFLLLVANGLPIIARNLLKDKFDTPIDFGIHLHDQHPLFGSSKTWRGALSSILGTGVVAYSLGFPRSVVTSFGFFAILGDLASSFIKRRMRLPESSKTRGLDVIPESLFPLLVLQDSLHLTLFDVIIIVGLFMLLEISLSPILYRLHIRKRPY